MKWFRVATEGATTDGRTLSRQWIEQMAKNFDPKKYGARVWMEHMRGLFHDGPFAALGDVKAVKAEEISEGDLAGKLGLYVQLDPTDELKQINGKRQKIYTSIEVDADFAGSGEAYLIGLAVTDSPASLGTEMLQFSAQQGAKSPLAHRKQRPENLFTASIEADLTELFDSKASGSDASSLLDSVKSFFSKHVDTSRLEMKAFRADLEKTMELFVTEIQSLQSELESRPSSEDHASLKSEFETLQSKFDDLYKRLDMTPDTPNRQPAKGDFTGVMTDC